MRKVLLYASLATMVTIHAAPSFGALPSAPTAETSSATTTSPSVDDAMRGFKNLSKDEKRQKFRDVKDVVKKYKQEKKAGNEPSTDTLLLVILAILLPPLAVYLHEGETNNRFWLSLILTLLFWIPGVIYALIVVLS